MLEFFSGPLRELITASYANAFNREDTVKLDNDLQGLAAILDFAYQFVYQIILCANH